MAAPSSSKSWWSRSKPPRDGPSLRPRPSLLSLAAQAQDAKPQSSYGSSKSRDHNTGSKFNSFVASAIGRKHKKPSLTIQDPPPPLITSFSTPPSVRSGTSPSAATSPSSYFTNRASRSAPTTGRSYEHDIDQASDYHTTSEPRTPSDHPRDRRSYQNSLLTLSDPDPFAAGAVIVSRFDQDPNRLSVYSDSSLLDPHAKRADAMPVNRMSYGSSSSNSHGNPDSLGAMPYQPVARVISDRDRAMSSEKRHNRETSVLLDFDMDPSGHLAFFDQLAGSTPSRARVISTASSNAVLPRSPASQQAAQLRQRGMTVAGDQMKPKPPPAPSRSAIPQHLQRQPSNDYLARSDASSTPSPIIFHSSRSSVSTTSTTTPGPPLTRPLVLVRKASSSRVNIPPLNTAPPSSRLPPPPLSPFTLSDLEESMESLVFPDVPSSSSSSLSFASMQMSSGDEIQHFMRDHFAEQEEDRYALTQSPPTTLRELEIEIPPRPRVPSSPTYARGPPPNSEPLRASSKVLKKAISQQNMGRHQPEPSVTSTSESSVYEDALSSPTQSIKALRKQRSFHRSRLPLPSLPLRHASSRTEPTEPTSPPLAPSTPQSTRRRLFSGSSGRRTSLSKGSSPPPSADDDVRSLLTLDAPPPPIARSGSPPAHTRAARPLMLSFANMGNQLALVTENACIAPAWDEIGSYNTGARAYGAYNTPYNGSTSTVASASGSSLGTTAKRASQAHSDYTPQHIMSPADMLRLEEELAHEEAGRTQRAQVREEEERRRVRERKARLELDPGDFGMSFAGPRQGADATTTTTTTTTRPRNDSVLSSRSSSSAATTAFGNGGGSGECPGTSSSAGTGAGNEQVSLRGVLLQQQQQHAAGPSARRPATASGLERQVPPSPRGMLSPPRRPTRPATAEASLNSSPLPSPSRTDFGRPTLQAHHSSPSPHHSSPDRPSPPQQPSMSLPPPPRPRPPREHIAHTAEEEDEEDADAFNKRASVAPFQPLSPPPARRAAGRLVPAFEDGGADDVLGDGGAGARARASVQIQSPPPPPPSAFTRPPSAFSPQRALNRRSIMRKPSFLDFEDAFEDGDDYDEDGDEGSDGGAGSPVHMRMSPADLEGSFLDLDRGKDSFDTIRSGDDHVRRF